MGSSFVAIAGGIGGLTLVIVTLLVWFFLSRKISNKDSETGSSDPSAAVEMKRGESTTSYEAPPLTGPHGARNFRMEELEQATRHFHESNLIGCGSFGLVYKGLLSDGTIVAIKRRNGHPRQEFIHEVAYLSTLQHRNLVKLLGYCQERGIQMLVFEYLPNGSICNHLYGTNIDSMTKLEFKLRLAIAIGAAKAGLCHLHNLLPPLAHSNFKTANVLVDEDFIARVSDAGVRKLLERTEGADASTSSSFNAFRDPELGSSNAYNETNDVYSFGIFLLELISGKEATAAELFRSNDSIHRWVQEHLNLNELAEQRSVGSYTAEGMRDVIRLMLKCLKFPGRERPMMDNIVVDLEQILEKEMTRTTVMGEGTATVILGSQLFMN